MLTLCVLFLLVDICFGCSCAPPHLQDAYCNMDIVILGKALKITSTVDPHFPHQIWRNTDTYEIEVLKAFKVPDSELMYEGGIITGISEGPCRAEIRRGEEFLLYASGSGKSITIHLCDYRRRSDLNEASEQSLSEGYDCRCKMSQCGFWYSPSITCDRCVQDKNGECKAVYGAC